MRSFEAKTQIRMAVVDLECFDFNIECKTQIRMAVVDLECFDFNIECLSFFPKCIHCLVFHMEYFHLTVSHS